jgi:DNA replication licensing factor MCM6
LFISFYNLPRIGTIRALDTDKISKLVSLNGTVTRTSEVRPELLFGAFTCRACGTLHPSVEQQYQYTEPMVCKNMNCNVATTDFQIVEDKCVFVDWQRIRLQENADEIPPV